MENTNNIGNCHVHSRDAEIPKLFGTQRFKNDFWDVSNTPFLKNSQSNIFCIVDETISYHSHKIVIASVLKANSAKEFNTLMYADGGYLN